MRIIVIVLLCIALAYYTIWEPLKNYANYGRPYNVNYLMVPLLAVMLIPTGVSEIQWQMMQHKGSSIVQEVSGNKDGHLKCQRLSMSLFDRYPLYAGYVEHDKPNTAVVKYRECQDLKKYFKHPDNPTIYETISFNVLIHESIHVSGEFNESIAECRAHQNHTAQAIKLGTPEKLALTNLANYITNYYPHLQKQYVSETGCEGLHPTLIYRATAE